MTTHKPGSVEAISVGCLCPLVENKFGEGYMEGTKGAVYLIDKKCPVHWTHTHRKAIPLKDTDTLIGSTVMFIDDEHMIRRGIFIRYNEEERVFEIRLPDTTVCKVRNLLFMPH